MKKTGIFLGICFLSFSVMSAELSVSDEAALLGTMSGLAEACGENSKKISDFELIAARLIAVKSATDEEEIAGYQRYAQEKMIAMQKQKNSPKISCNEVLRRFDSMPIFKSVVYSDGSLKLSDGTFLKATRPPAKLNKNK